MNKLKIVLMGIGMLLMIPFQTNAASLWTGNGVYKEDMIGYNWGVTSDMIAKEENPGRVYPIEDLSTYSAYITNVDTLEGNNIKDGFYWYNKSRIAYVKLIKVNPGQEVSFLFSKERYVYCAEYSSDFTLVNYGKWLTTGDKVKMSSITQWIMVVFRNPRGTLEDGSGTDVDISVNDISSLSLKYIILEPFRYTFKLNGGYFNGSTEAFMLERLGVSQMKLPLPSKKGYIFEGWKASDGKIYKSSLPVEYNKALFADTSLEAVWTEIKPSGITLDRETIILEQNAEDVVKLTAKVMPANALDQSIRWYSSDEETATVDSEGKITAGRPGKTVITAETSNGLKSSCIVYVMGFEVKIPTRCTPDEKYEINVNVFYNGEPGMNGRKRILLETEDKIQLVRVGDENTTYDVLAESSVEYNGSFKDIQRGGYIVDTCDSVTVYYRLTPEESIKKAGDYEGNVTFTVSVL